MARWRYCYCFLYPHLLIPSNHILHLLKQKLLHQYKPHIHHLIDKDNDGIDDQTDILNNANNYIKTNPKYKSKYYNTGII